MGKPGPPPKVTLPDVLAVFEERGDSSEPLTATEIAEALGCSRRTAHDKLQALADRGEIESKKVGGRAVVWWRPSAAAATTVIDPDDPLFSGEPLIAPDDPVDPEEIDAVLYDDPDA